MHADTNCPGGGVGSMRKPADKGGGLKIDKILQTTFMDSPPCNKGHIISFRSMYIVICIIYIIHCILLYGIGIHYTLYTVYTIQYSVCRICYVYCTGVDPTEIFINAIAIMNPGKFNRQPIQYTV